MLLLLSIDEDVEETVAPYIVSRNMKWWADLESSLTGVIKKIKITYLSSFSFLGIIPMHRNICRCTWVDMYKSAYYSTVWNTKMLEATWMSISLRIVK